jgi:hypothetical protein
MLFFNEIVEEGFNKRSFLDHRVKVNYLIISYLDTDNIEYRKKLEFDISLNYQDMVNLIPKNLESPRFDDLSSINKSRLRHYRKSKLS